MVFIIVHYNTILNCIYNNVVRTNMCCFILEVKDLALLIKKLESRIDSLEKVGKLAGTSSKSAVTSKPTPAPAPSPVKPKDDDDDDDGVDLFGSDSEVSMSLYKLNTNFCIECKLFLKRSVETVFSYVYC